MALLGNIAGLPVSLPEGIMPPKPLAGISASSVSTQVGAWAVLGKCMSLLQHYKVVFVLRVDVALCIDTPSQFLAQRINQKPF